MPSADEILTALSESAHRGVPLAIAWHVVVTIVLGAVAAGRWVPSRRSAALTLALPLVSVGSVAVGSHNPFNGIVFGAGAILLFGVGAGLDATPVLPGPRWSTAAGAASIAFGLLYPHFLADRPLYHYLFAAPVGIVPCPTLAVVCGFALLGGGISRGLSWTLGGMAVFYALFGTLRLHVWLDTGLLASAMAVLACAVGGVPHGPEPARNQ